MSVNIVLEANDVRLLLSILMLLSLALIPATSQTLPSRSLLEMTITTANPLVGLFGLAFFNGRELSVGAGAWILGIGGWILVLYLEMRGDH